ncbi:hypothetical protein SAMN05421774_102675 [Gemmobacter megaterium]|uniref:50S ribosomal protein L35 n=1 Tax=Gemmobacter megaterium TaxID=1086013 RepID=A0A1N7MGQ6_9RHOB|nr:hypothetical protein [Gemmobacter megaterium]GGE06843.1 hypothetical protein GCM10011345_10610 [Gemmobacter megaterium]SIS85253.1 hypothetical protein SAMN05421774_102675 [Gemmobacter megaterium]
MNSDLMLVVGLIVGVLTIPALLNAWTEGRPPRAAAIMVMIAIGLVVMAVRLAPGGYALDDLPDVFFRVVGRLMN